jgi:hypothetical protein
MDRKRLLLALVASTSLATAPTLPAQDDQPPLQPRQNENGGNAPSGPNAPERPPQPPRAKPGGDDNDRPGRPGGWRGRPNQPGGPDDQCVMPVGKVQPPDLRQKVEKMPPERRQEFLKNFKLWANMTPEQRQAIREQERRHIERMHNEVDAAIKESGLDLDEKQKGEFAVRYLQERSKIERQIFQEMEARRRPLIKEMVERLTKEFSDKAPNAPAPPVPPCPVTAGTASPEAAAK